MISLLDVYNTEFHEAALFMLYELMREREPEINISHEVMPTWEEHRKLVESKPYRCWYVIGLQPLPHVNWAGSISATEQNEIGIVLFSQCRGHGIGPAAIKELMLLHSPLPAIPSKRSGKWLANIAPGNMHSQHIFKKLGFKRIQCTYAYEEASK